MKNLIECVRSGNVSYRGEYTKKLEKVLSDYVEAYVICTNSGTSALQLALTLLNLDYRYVLVPSITYRATINAIIHSKGEPFFVDSSKDDLNIDLEKLENDLKREIIPAKAIVPVHVLGYPVDMDPLTKIAERYKLYIVEDACQALGSFYKGKHCGTMGVMGAISFNGNKLVTTGGGGAFITKNKEYYEKALDLSMQCRNSNNGVGYNFRMPAINAAFGQDQWEEKKEFFEDQKHESKSKEYVWNHWKEVDNKGVPIWKPNHQQPMYKYCEKMDMSGAEWIGENVRISED